MYLLTENNSIVITLYFRLSAPQISIVSCCNKSSCSKISLKNFYIAISVAKPWVERPKYLNNVFMNLIMTAKR